MFQKCPNIYSSKNAAIPRDYGIFNISYVLSFRISKGFIFVPKPDEFLMKDKNLENYYNWVTGMKNAPYTDVIEAPLPRPQP